MVATRGSWGRLAPSLVAMVTEADRIAPHRSKASDGSLGDQSHSARSSFHNPSRGYVDALDLTHDPGHGFDAHARARQIAARRDHRIDHIISNRRIWSALRPYWRFYFGINGHTKHAHFAVKRSTTGRASTLTWWTGTANPGPANPLPPIEEDDMTPDQDKRLTRIEADAERAARVAEGLVNDINLAQKTLGRVIDKLDALAARG